MDSIHPASRTDELWIVKDKTKDALLGIHGKRSWIYLGRALL